MEKSLRSDPKNGPRQAGILCAFALGAMLVLLPGCEALRRYSGLAIQRTPTVVRAASTNWVEVRHTNYVGVTTYLTNFVTIRAAVTNADTGLVLPAVVQPQVVPTGTVVAQVVTNWEAIVLPAIVVTNTALSPVAIGTIQTAADLAPVPWAGTVASIGVGVAGAVFGWLNKRRAKQALGEALGWKDTTAVLTENIDLIRTSLKQLPGYTENVDRAVMLAVQSAQAAAGVKSKVVEVLEHPDRQEPAAVDLRGQIPDQPLEAVTLAARSDKPLKESEWSVRDWMLIQLIRSGAIKG